MLKVIVAPSRLQAAAAAPGGRQARAHLGAAAAPAAREATLARAPPAPLPTLAQQRSRAPAGFLYLVSWVRGACGVPSRLSERAGASAYHFKHFSIQPRTLLIPSLARLRPRLSNRPCLTWSSMTEVRSAPAGSCSLCGGYTARPPACSLTHTRTHQHTISHHILTHTKFHAGALYRPSVQAPKAAAPKQGEQCRRGCRHGGLRRRCHGAVIASCPPGEAPALRPPGGALVARHSPAQARGPSKKCSWRRRCRSPST